jgi:hypothetical protein
MVTILAIPNMSFRFPVRQQSEGAVSILHVQCTCRNTMHIVHSVSAISDILKIDCKPFVPKHPLPPKRYAFAVNPEPAPCTVL